jgi:hypothetical protein
MPTEDAEFRQGEPGVDEQMGQGEAAELNDGLELAREMDDGTQDVGAAPAGPEEEAADDGMDDASMADFAPQGGVQNEDMKFVTGPTLKPNEAQWVGARSASGPVSPRVRRRLHTLQKAASAPGASPRLQAMVKWLVENS